MKLYNIIQIEGAKLRYVSSFNLVENGYTYRVDGRKSRAVCFSLADAQRAMREFETTMQVFPCCGIFAILEK